MNRREYLKFCKVCTKRKFNSRKGLVCSLTNEIAKFEGNCVEFEKDNFVKIQKLQDNNKKNPDKNAHLLLFSIILLVSGIISYFIQKSNFLYKGDSLGNVVIFLFSFFVLSILMYKFLMPVKLSFLHVKSISGILSVIYSIALFLFSLPILIVGKFVSLGVIFLIVGVYNFIFLLSTKFWDKGFLNKNYKTLAIMNITLITIPFIELFSLKRIKLDSEERLILIAIFIGVLVNYLYSINLLRKK